MERPVAGGLAFRVNRRRAFIPVVADRNLFSRASLGAPAAPTNTKNEGLTSSRLTRLCVIMRRPGLVMRPPSIGYDFSPPASGEPMRRRQNRLLRFSALASITLAAGTITGPAAPSYRPGHGVAR